MHFSRPRARGRIYSQGRFATLATCAEEKETQHGLFQRQEGQIDPGRLIEAEPKGEQRAGERQRSSPVERPQSLRRSASDDKRSDHEYERDE
jgi:hypothetical protein